MDPKSDVFKFYLEKAEDYSDVIIRKVRPYARGLAKLCILFFHFAYGMMIITHYSTMSEFISWTFGLRTYEAMERSGRSSPRSGDGEEKGEEEKNVHLIDTINIFGHIVTWIIFLTRIVPIYFVLADKHVIPACAALGAFPLVMGVHFSYWSPAHANWLALTCFGLLGSLTMLAAEQLENKVDLGIPSLGLNRNMSVVTLIARLLILCISLNVKSGLYKNVYVSYPILYYLHMLVLVPGVICICVGYRTKLVSVVLSAYLFLVGLYLNPFWKYFDQPFVLGFSLVMFGATLAAIGGLMYINMLGAGQYSVDHIKKT